MKRFLALLLILIFGIIFFTACGNRNSLVGTWVWTVNEEFTYVFNADGTGTRGRGDALDNFTWEIGEEDEQHLRMIMISGPTFESEYRNNESWTFVINRNYLTITSRQADLEWTYRRD